MLDAPISDPKIPTIETTKSYKTNQQPTSSKQQRPTIITVICVLGLLGAAITIPIIFSDVAVSIGSWYPPYLAFSAVIGLVCMYGFWNMKKWAVYTYIAFILLNQAVLLTMGVWGIGALLIPGIVAGLAFSQLDKMD